MRYPQGKTSKYPEPPELRLLVVVQRPMLRVRARMDAPNI
jgi:hypothetical protein